MLYQALSHVSYYLRSRHPGLRAYSAGCVSTCVVDLCDQDQPVGQPTSERTNLGVQAVDMGSRETTHPPGLLASACRILGMLTSACDYTLAPAHIHFYIMPLHLSGVSHPSTSLPSFHLTSTLPSIVPLCHSVTLSLGHSATLPLLRLCDSATLPLTHHSPTTRPRCLSPISWNSKQSLDLDSNAESRALEVLTRRLRYVSLPNAWIFSKNDTEIFFRKRFGARKTSEGTRRRCSDRWAQSCGPITT